MKKLLGPHLGGQWANNLEILRKWQPPLILVLQPEVDKVKQLRDACPDAIIIGRFFHDDSHYADNINARPKEFAREIHQEIANNPVTPLLHYAQSNNEVCQDWASIQKLNVFTQEWMHLADQSQAYKCAILAFSVGNPDLPHKPGDPAGFDGKMLYWQQVLPSLNYAQANDHILLMHAYGFPNMFAPDAAWYIYRYERQVQANLRKLGIANLKYMYGEIGIDRFIVNAKGGYKVVPTTDEGYVNQTLQWERDLQGQELLLGGAIFTFGDSGGWDTYDITSTDVASMIATHYADHAGDYDAPDSPDDGGHTVFIPATGTGQPAQSTLPERQIDPRATARGVMIETPSGSPLTWRVTKVQWYNEQEADALGPDHHIMADVLDEQGKRLVGVPLLVTWPTDEHRIVTEAKPGEPYSANYPMSPSRNEFSIKVDGLALSEIVKGIGMGADTPSGFNPGIHTTTGVVFQRVNITTPTQPPSEGPTPVEPTIPVTPGNERDNWTRAIAFIREWEGGWADNPADPGGATNKGITIGTFIRWRESRGLPTPTKDDLRNITDAEANKIFYEWYWKESGADKLPWPLALAHFDTAVNAGPGRAKEMLTKSNGNFLGYMGHLIDWYTRINNFETFGRAWIRRRADILLEASK